VLSDWETSNRCAIGSPTQLTQEASEFFYLRSTSLDLVSLRRSEIVRTAGLYHLRRAKLKESSVIQEYLDGGRSCASYLSNCFMRLWTSNERQSISIMRILKRCKR